MSFELNDTNDNNMIHLGNYEEFFILYLDNELSEEQVKMVDAFLVRHPDLQGEFELLMSTRLPMEELRISKNELLAGRMKLSTVDEELLLYIDNELPAEGKKVLDLELKSNKDYQLQHEILMKTKLDPSEKLTCPNKKELYRKEERRVVMFRPWMRVAAAVVVIAVAGLVYFTSSSNRIIDPVAHYDKNGNREQTENKITQPGLPATNQDGINTGKNEIARQTVSDEIRKPKSDDNKPDLPKEMMDNIDNVVQQNQEILANTDPVVLKNKTPLIENTTLSDVARTTTVIATPSEIINNSAVTSATANRKTEVVDTPKKNDNEGVASNKGSVKGFLRKTTRLIEKRTGIDPTSDGELLIGAVAINLN